VENDDSIPTRSNKKTGAKSKKEIREQVNKIPIRWRKASSANYNLQAQAEATEELKDICIRHGFVSGKWFVFFLK
jgi:hypothetical protein